MEEMSFATVSGFRQWLGENHASSSGFWMRIAKKGARKRTISYKEALDAALCGRSEEHTTEIQSLA